MGSFSHLLLTISPLPRACPLSRAYRVIAGEGDRAEWMMYNPRWSAGAMNTPSFPNPPRKGGSVLTPGRRRANTSVSCDNRPS